MQSNTNLVVSQDKRFNDIMLYFTLFLGLFGIGTYFKAKHDAKETAQQFMDDWLKDKATHYFDRKVDEVLKTKDDEINDLIEGQIKDRVEPLLSSMKASLKDVEAHKDKAKTHVDELDKLSLKAKEIFKDIPKEELEKIEAKEVNSLTSNEHYKLGVNAITDGKLNSALNEFEHAISLLNEVSPESENLFFAKGFVLSELKEYDKAIEAYRKAIEMNPKNDRAYNNMGTTYQNKKEYDKEIEAYKQAIEINPQNDRAYINMGTAYYSLRKFEEAIKFYIKAININPNNSGAYTNLFELQLTRNQSFDQSLEKKYMELFQNKKENFMEYKMLKVLQDIVQNQEVNLEEWVQKYRGISLGDWSFDELNEWIGEVEDTVLKTKLQEALEVFKGHR